MNIIHRNILAIMASGAIALAMALPAAAIDIGGVSVGGNDNGGSARSVSSATSNTLTASSPGWSTDEWKGYTVWVDDDFSTATGSQFRYILSNTADTLTIAGTWSTTPDATCPPNPR